MIRFASCLRMSAYFFMILFFPQTALAGNSESEGIFIETISELNNGRLTLNEIRTRPATISKSSQKIFIETDGYYISDVNLNENPLVAQDRAKADAKRLLSEQASIYVKSISETQKNKLTRDEVHTISVTILQIQNESFTIKQLANSSVQYCCHISALIDTSNVFEQLNPADKEKFEETVRRTIEIERESARLNSELIALKQRYKTASKDDQAKISSEVKRNEQSFTATLCIEKGFELYNQNDFNGAIECFNDAIRINPNYVSAWNGLGCVENYRRNFDKAIEYCYKAIELDENSSDSWNNLGYAYSYKGNFDRAIECYKKSIEINPLDAVSQINLGNVYDSLGNHDLAITFYLKALEISSDYANAFNSLGYAYIQKSDFDNGILYCKKALEIDPHYAAAWNGLGYSYNQKGKFHKAIECCRKAVALNKNYANAWNNLGYACSKINHYEDSFTAYRNAVRFAPNVELYKSNLEIAKRRIDSFKSL